jgi:hypothetical protein
VVVSAGGFGKGDLVHLWRHGSANETTPRH